MTFKSADSPWPEEERRVVGENAEGAASRKEERRVGCSRLSRVGEGGAVALAEKGFGGGSTRPIVSRARSSLVEGASNANPKGSIKVERPSSSAETLTVCAVEGEMVERKVA